MIKNIITLPRKSICCVRYSSHIKPFKYLSAPVKAGIDISKLPAPTKINQATIEYLEKVSLVGFENDRAVRIVEEAIRFADQIFEVNTDNVEPMVSVLENECLQLREDTVIPDTTRKDLLSHAIKSSEHYYVTPTPGKEPSKIESKQIDQPRKMSKILL